MLSFLPPEITAAGTTILPRRFKLYHYLQIDQFDFRFNSNTRKLDPRLRDYERPTNITRPRCRRFACLLFRASLVANFFEGILTLPQQLIYLPVFLVSIKDYRHIKLPVEVFCFGEWFQWQEI